MFVLIYCDELLYIMNVEQTLNTHSASRSSHASAVDTWSTDPRLQAALTPNGERGKVLPEELEQSWMSFVWIHGIQ